MNVVFISSLHLQEYDGALYHNYMGVFLQRYMYLGNVTCCCFKEKVDKCQVAKIEVADKVNFRFIRQENSIKGRFLATSFNDKIWEEVIPACDLVIIHLTGSLGNRAMDFVRRYHKPYIAVVIGCVWGSLWNHGIKGKLMAPLEFFSKRRIIKNADYAIYVTKHFLQHRYPTNGTNTYCSNVDIRTPDESVLNERISRYHSLCVNDQFKIITTAAVNVRYKGQEYVIRAMRKCPNVHYYLAGGGDQTFLRDLADKCGVADRVHFLGEISHDRVLELCKEMDLYIQPSLQEGLPRAMIEAMSMAMPAIGARTAGIPELINQKYIVRQRSVNDIVKILQNISREELIAMALENYKEAQQYDSDILNARRIRFFDDIKKAMPAK